MSQHLRDAVSALVDQVKLNPQAARAVFRASTVSASEGFTTQATVRGFGITLDEPRELGGEDLGPNPVEAVLAALGSCQAIVYRAYAATLGLRLDRVQVEVKGVLDLRGFLNLAPVDSGFTGVAFTARIESPEPPEKLRELARLVSEHCPVLDTLQRAVNVTGDVEIVSTVGAQRASAT